MLIVEFVNSLNKIGKIKTIIIVLLSILSALTPIRQNTQIEDLLFLIFPLIFGSIAIPVIIKLNQIFFKREVFKPSWNDNSLSIKRPLSFFHFYSIWFTSGGIS